MRRHRVPLVPDAPSFEDWTPTRDNINALPKAVRRYIRDLESKFDTVETMRENFRLRRENAELKKEIASERALLIDQFFFSED
jgi:hypothetical protein